MDDPIERCVKGTLAWLDREISKMNHRGKMGSEITSEQARPKMPSPDNFNEPWTLWCDALNRGWIEDANFDKVVDGAGRHFDLRDLRRIVACVNFLRGVPTEKIEEYLSEGRTFAEASVVFPCKGEIPEDGVMFMELTPKNET